jgi:acetyl-CoA carboxylase biotin carboxylase subunit
VYAEDAESGFLPSPGRITSLRVPAGPWVRDDGGIEGGGEVPLFYDPLVSKLVAWGENRHQALARMQRALREYEAVGIETTVPFFTWLLQDPGFVEARFHTGYLDELLQERQGRPFSVTSRTVQEVAAIAVAVTLATRTAGGARVESGAYGGESGTPVGAAGARPPAGGTWTRRARLEALRG